MFDLTFHDLAGKSVTLHGQCGAKLTLVYHFMGWCASCHTLSGEFGELVSEFGPAGLELLFVISEDTAKNPATNDYCAKMEDKFGLSASVLSDPDAQLSQFGGAGTAILADPGLAIVFKSEGPSIDALRWQIEEWL